MLVIQPNAEIEWAVFSPTILKVIIEEKNDTHIIKLASLDGTEQSAELELLNDSFFFHLKEKFKFKHDGENVYMIFSKTYSASIVLHSSEGMKFYSGIVSTITTPHRAIYGQSGESRVIHNLDPQTSSTRFMLLEWPQ